MIKTHNLGFPRIGAKRELKFTQESFWRGELTEAELQANGNELREKHWQQQVLLDYVPVGDFSFYDQVLDMSFTLGHQVDRVKSTKGSELDRYFRVARGRSANDGATHCLHAGEMTKWFDTNYHYIVPEFSADTAFSLNPNRLLEQLQEAKNRGLNSKPVIIGPLTYLWLGKEKDSSNKLDLLERLLLVYAELLEKLANAGVEWLQVDEPILVTDLAENWQNAFEFSYQQLAKSAPTLKILLTTYFGELKENLSLVAKLPVAGVHLDAVRGRNEVDALIHNLPADRVISLGVINGRNIWKTDLTETLQWLSPIAKNLKQRLWIAPSCSLLHVPVDINQEVKLDDEIGSWLSFAVQKLDELHTLASVLNHGEQSVADRLEDNQQAIQSRQNSTRVHNLSVKSAVNAMSVDFGNRQSPYTVRAEKQRQRLQLPLFPTTTIGSFPQTPEIRAARLKFKRGELSSSAYREQMQAEIRHCVKVQEELEIDVLVHGEPERNDMVEYFGEQLVGYAFSQYGWVQSYGSRCVKPPIIYGDISRPHAMTVEWSRYAQSLTQKPMKGMLTGPVTILNWSFVRDDQPRSQTCYQLALAIREEVQDLEKAGINIIQIDEAALREGLPLRRSQWQEYLDWAVSAFRICANGVNDETQIHTHMCYSEFNDIIESIARMDADVITIETSRSDMELLDVFDSFHYPNEIGPGVYDIHSPNLPAEGLMVKLMKLASLRIPAERLWVNPDCGLKTRRWEEVTPALKAMVGAAKELRKNV